jgi:hypothetical protein
MFAKFKISNNFKQNIGETDSAEQPRIHRKIHNRLWILKISRINPRLLPNLCDL